METIMFIYFFEEKTILLVFYNNFSSMHFYLIYFFIIFNYVFFQAVQIVSTHMTNVPQHAQYSLPNRYCMKCNLIFLMVNHDLPIFWEDVTIVHFRNIVETDIFFSFLHWVCQISARKLPSLLLQGI